MKLLKQDLLTLLGNHCQPPEKKQTTYCHIRSITYAITRDISRGQLNLRAMGLVYTTLLSLVPLLAFSFSILQGFGIHNKMEPLMLQLLEPLGEKAAIITEQIITFVSNINTGVLGTTGLILLIYTVVSLMKKIEEAFNYTWRVSNTRSLGSRFSHYLSIVLIAPILMFTALGLWAAFLDTSLIQNLNNTYGNAFGTLTSYLPKVLIILTFGIFYIVIPNTHVKVKSALIGALLAGLLWQTGSWAFASFVVNSTKQTAIYSAFASLMFFMLWMYLSWLILLIGASIAFYVQHPESIYYEQAQLPQSPQLKHLIAIGIMQLAYKQAERRLPPLTSQQYAKQLSAPEPLVQQTVDLLLAHRLLVENSAFPACYSPYYPATQLSMEDISLAVYEGTKKQMNITEQTLRNSEVLKEISEKISNKSGGILVREI